MLLTVNLDKFIPKLLANAKKTIQPQENHLYAEHWESAVDPSKQIILKFID